MLAVSQTVWVGHSCPTMPTVFQSRPQLRPRNQVPYLQHSTPEPPRISTVLTPSPPASRPGGGGKAREFAKLGKGTTSVVHNRFVSGYGFSRTARHREEE